MPGSDSGDTQLVPCQRLLGLCPERPDSPLRACLARPATTCPPPVPGPFSPFRVPIGLGTPWGTGDHLSSLVVVVVELSNVVLDPLENSNVPQIQSDFLWGHPAPQTHFSRGHVPNQAPVGLSPWGQGTALGLCPPEGPCRAFAGAGRGQRQLRVSTALALHGRPGLGHRVRPPPSAFGQPRPPLWRDLPCEGL